MSQKVLETEFPLMVPPNPPIPRTTSRPHPADPYNPDRRAAPDFPPDRPHRQSVDSTGRTGSLRRAYSSDVSADEREPLNPRESPKSSTSDYHSDSIQQPPFRLPTTTYRHRKHEDDSMSGAAKCCLFFLIFLAQILLWGCLALVLYWIMQYHSKEIPGEDTVYFSWRKNPELEWNLHPVLMIAGFIFFMGQAMLMYRTMRCCRRIWNKLLHSLFHIFAIPCIAIGFIAVLDSHNLRQDREGNPQPIPNFYSLHSWLGLATMGLFALQFVVGFFSFLLLLCCESATASFRASLVPIHATFGITTFVMAVATSCTGLTEKAFFTLSIAYSKWVPYLSDPLFNRTTALTGLSTLGPAYTDAMFAESLVINVLAAALVGLAVLMPVIVLHPRFRFRPQRVITVTHDRYG